MADLTGLVELDGMGIRVLASRGTEERARAIGERTARANDWLSDLLGFTPTVTVCALAPPDWSRVTDFPVFGFPHFVDGDLIVVGSEPAAFFDGLIDTMLPSLSHQQMAEVHRAYGNPPHAYAFSDLLAIHELAHLYHSQGGFWFPERWLSELFCQISLEGWITEQEPHAGDQLRTLPRCFRSVDDSSFLVRDLHRMEQALEVGPTGPVNYAWYQCVLHDAATSIWSEAGRGVLRRLYERFEDGSVPDDLRRALVTDVHPVFGTLIDHWPAWPFRADRPPRSATNLTDN